MHHDPRAQKEYRDGPRGQRISKSLFTEEECQTRIRLWDILMIHDRGTAILLGRPLAIAPSDSNVPIPVRTWTGKHADFSEHFDLSHPIAVIQADVVNSLYTPQKLYGQQLLRVATRIIESMVHKRNEFPNTYRHYFTGTQEWSHEQRARLVEKLTADEGLTLLKMGITRLLLMRAMFREENGLPQAIQKYALTDAIITAHNIIVVHSQLLQYPEIAFFVSPIPLHIAAFVILLGHSQKCERLTPDVEKQDVWMALDMLPRSRWRWERKDLNGGHPVIHDLAQRVLNVDLAEVGPPKAPQVLLCEESDWNKVRAEFESNVNSHSAAKAQVKHEQYAPGASEPRMTGEITQAGFYPFYPENVQPDPAAAAIDSHGRTSGGNVGRTHEEWSQIMAQQGAVGAYQQSQSSFMQEEKDVAPSPHGVPQWMQAVSSLLH